MLKQLVISYLQVSLICSVGIVLMIILRETLFKKYTRNFIYYLWLFIALKLIIPFKFSVYLSEKLCNILEYSQIDIITKETALDKIFICKSNIITSNVNYNIMDIFQIISYLWIIGVAMFSFHYIYIYFRFTRKLKLFSHNIIDNNIINIYSELISGLKIKKKISLKYCEGINSPLGTGFFRPCILLPKVTYSSEELKWILKHELIHFKKYDLFFKLIVIIIISLHWFNPFVYVMRKAINNDCELACDESVLKHLNIKEKKLYAIALINSMRLTKSNISQNNIITGFNNNNKNILKRRVEYMLNLKTRKKGIGIGILVTMLVISSFLSIKTFASNNKTKMTSTSQVSVTETPSATVYKGTLNDMPEDLKKLLEDDQYIKSNPNDELIVKKGKGSLKKYTYANAPADIRAEHEQNCKSVNKTPSPSDVIYVPEK